MFSDLAAVIDRIAAGFPLNFPEKYLRIERPGIDDQSIPGFPEKKRGKKMKEKVFVSLVTSTL